MLILYLFHYNLPQTNIEDDYYLGTQEIGRGGCGVVVVGEKKREGGCTFTLQDSNCVYKSLQFSKVKVPHPQRQQFALHSMPISSNLQCA